jgi:transcriptional antiterminator Rof (Rho-off)
MKLTEPFIKPDIQKFELLALARRYYVKSQELVGEYLELKAADMETNMSKEEYIILVNNRKIWKRMINELF